MFRVPARKLKTRVWQSRAGLGPDLEGLGLRVGGVGLRVEGFGFFGV